MQVCFLGREIRGCAGKPAARAVTLLLLAVLAQAAEARSQLGTFQMELALPESPGWVLSGDAPQDVPGRMVMALGTAGLAGVVVDSTGAAVPGARIVLTRGGGGIGSVTSAGHGEFSFNGLPSGAFRVTVQAAGFLPVVSAEIRVGVGESVTLPQFVLAVAGAGSAVDVYASEREVAQVQVKEAEQQRVFGVLPNFYSSYLWDAAPMAAKQKFDLAAHSAFDPVAFIGAGIVAGVEVARNTFPAYGTDSGFGIRYAASLADQWTARFIGSAVLPSVFHQDPRYFYRGTGSIRSRALYAISSAVICRGDNGHLQPNYSYVLGAFASGGISYTYHVGSDRSASLLFRNGFTDIGGHAVQDLIREFALRRITHKVPAFEQGKPPDPPAKP